MTVPQIDTVTTRHARRYAVVPLLAQEPVGIEPLLALAQPQVAVTEGA